MKNTSSLTWKVGMSAFVMAGTVSVAAPSHAGLFKGISEQEEIRAGEQVAAQAQKEYGRALPASNPMSRRVRAIGMQFARLSNRKNIPYSYTVLQNDKVLNAFAAPGGPIFVTTKLVNTTANDAELAYVLGHETAHIDRKHIVKAVEKQQKQALGIGILGAVLGGGRAVNIGAAIVNTALTQKYSRGDENDADAVGARFMSQLGYDPRAAISMLGKLDDGKGSGGITKYLASHPDPKSRQGKVQTQIQKENLLDVARRMGGPRLSTNISNDGYRYGQNTTYNTGNTGTQATYPEDTGYDNGATTSTTNDDYYSPNDTNRNGQTSDGRAINLTAPILSVQRGGRDVVLAPVADLARWGGASVRVNDRVLIMQRGRNSLELRLNSTVAYVNGKAVTMSAAALQQNGTFYAPIGIIAEGLGGTAAYDNAREGVVLTLDSGATGFVPTR